MNPIYCIFLYLEKHTCMRACMLTSVVFKSVTPWTVVCWVPQSMGFSRQEYWGGCPALPTLLTEETIFSPLHIFASFVE